VAIALALVGLYAVLQGGDDDGTDTATTASTTTASPTSTTVVSYGTTACPPVDGAATATQKFTSPFKQCIDAAKTYTAVITTNKGELTVKLDPTKAPRR